MSRISSRAVILSEDETKVLLIHRIKKEQNGKVRDYYVVPGGGVEDNESLENTAIRELKEELNVDINILGYVGLEKTPQGYSNYFSAMITNGVPHLGGEELEKNNPDNFYMPIYVPIQQLQNLNVFGKEFIELAINKQYLKLDNAVLTDQGICPTCYNKKFDNVIFGDNSEMIVYQDDLIEAFFVGSPRAKGHLAIFSIKHYKDMTEIDDELNTHIYKLSKKAMISLKQITGAESIYLCTMCDGPNNHFHIQLIPRYATEKRGSINFVKPRQEYKHDPKTVEALRLLLNN